MAVTGTGTGVIHITSSTDVLSTANVYVLSSLRWVGATAATHQCIVTDGAGNVIFSSIANGANYVDGWVFDNKWIAGLAFTTMASGAVDLYLANR